MQGLKKFLRKGIIEPIDRHYQVITLLLIVATIVFSLMPARLIPHSFGSDKLHHFLGYLILTLPIAIAQPRHYLYYALSLVGLSGIIELIQPCFHRYSEMKDFIANTAGVISGLILGKTCKKMLMN